MTTDQARDKTNYKGTQNVWRLSFKRIKKEEKNHDDCWAAKTRQKKRLKSPCWAAGNRNEKKRKLPCWTAGYRKKKRKQLPCWAT